MSIEASMMISVARLPVSVQRVVEQGVRAVDPKRVVLYGSRARGDARENSDFDLAFVFSKTQRGRWIRFLADLDDAGLTLQPVELLDWNEASEPLREQIRKEGIILYERASGD
ncbi:MAG: nucleotidyltransferase domain-containing protein [Pirellulales bacterium]|nr:nucleotidyltransferase domain-containing protein [Pirellulales bacterium]